MLQPFELVDVQRLQPNELLSGDERHLLGRVHARMSVEDKPTASLHLHGETSGEEIRTKLHHVCCLHKISQHRVCSLTRTLLSTKVSLLRIKHQNVLSPDRRRIYHCVALNLQEIDTHTRPQNVGELQVDLKHSVLLQRVLVVAVHAVCVTVRVSSPRLVQDQGPLLLLAQAVVIC